MTSAMGDAVLVLTQAVELSILGKATVMLVLGLIAVRLAVRARAAVRHLLLASTFGALFAVPLIVLAGPDVTFEVPVSRAALVAVPDAQSAVVETPYPSPLPASGTRERNSLSRSRGEGQGAGAPFSFSWSTLARVVWFAGFALVIAPLAISLWRVRQLRRHGLPPPPELRELTRTLAAASRLRRPVSVLLHEAIPAPITWGAWRPTIMLPMESREWAEADLRRALVHELEHVRRSDWGSQLFARTICACYWFHPLAWAAWRQLCLEAERACDDAVVGSADRTDYADQLVTLARRMSTAHAQPTLGMANRSDLSTRVNALLDETQRRGRAGLLTEAAAIGAAVIVVLTIAPVRAVATQTPDGDAASARESTSVSAATSSGTQRQGRALGHGQGGGLGQGQGGGLGTGQESASARRESNASTERTDEERPGSRRGSALNRALLEAASDGNMNDVDALIRAGADVNGAVSGDGSPLIAAARSGHLDVASMLIDRGADPDMGVKGDGNPLIMAAARGHLKIVTLLLDRGASVDTVVDGDENALIQASAGGHLDVVKLLVARGADVNSRIWADGYGSREGEWRTPLNRAQRAGHAAVVAFLQANGARE